MSSMSIDIIPCNIDQFYYINYIDLSQNLIQNLIQNLLGELMNIVNIRVLLLTTNLITSVPRKINKLVNVTAFSVCNNRLCNLPAVMFDINKTADINIDFNFYPNPITYCSYIDRLNYLKKNGYIF